jgi:glycosyltransferase involved in cell wall biosynthesis
MTKVADCVLSVVVPLYNEEASIDVFHKSLIKILDKTADSYEVIYCDDGSSDRTSSLVKAYCATNPNLKLIKLSRNFGKESALSAGISTASGQAVIMIDGDGQHPVELIPKFVESWRDGNKVVIGIRAHSAGAQAKNFGSWVFYKLFNHLTGQKLIPGSTDFRLIDKSVQQAFLELPETDRITRGLIDWLGFKRQFIEFRPKPRKNGEASYSRRQLMKLAMNSFVSLSPRPLYMFSYLGMFITTAALILGIAVTIEQLILSDPLNWNFTGTAMLGILILFLVGIVLLSQGVLALYISHTHSQSLRRPLYIIDYADSIGVNQSGDSK